MRILGRALAAGVTAAGVGAAMLVPAVPALAATTTVTMVNGVLTYRAAAGQANALYISATMNGVTGVSDTWSPMTAGAGCTQSSATSVRCDSLPTVQVKVYLGDKDDEVKFMAVPYPKLIEGGEGNDTIYNMGMQHSETSISHILRGGPGEDRIWGGAGRDRLEGGADRDWLYGRDGADEIVGGPGRDILSGNEDGDVISVDAERVSNPGTGDYDLVNCGTGDDTVYGDEFWTDQMCETLR
jgi:Ca2+-binding RTX toxin-like protein